MTLREAERAQTAGERLAKIASSYLYVERGTPVYDLLAELKEPYRRPIAVVDGERRPVGIIVPRDLVDILGKPFGRDLLKRQRVEDIMREATSRRHDEHVQELLARVDADPDAPPDEHFVLVDGNGRFCGHVTSHDLVVHATVEHRRELETATRIQRRLVSPSLSVFGRRASVTCASVMAQGVGGDYYYAREYRDGRWFFCLCDISGKGISAAIVTAVLASFLRDADLERPLEDTVSRLNAIILGTFKLEKYLTGFFARFSEETGELEYCDMGHSYFYAIEGTNVHPVTEGADNLPIGLAERLTLTTRTLRVAPGSSFLLVSDGVVEQTDRAGRTFPLARAGECLGAASGSADGAIRAQIRFLESFFAFKGDVPQHDDVSMLIFRYGPEPAP